MLAPLLFPWPCSGPPTFLILESPLTVLAMFPAQFAPLLTFLGCSKNKGYIVHVDIGDLVAMNSGLQTYLVDCSHHLTHFLDDLQLKRMQR